MAQPMNYSLNYMNSQVLFGLSNPIQVLQIDEMKVKLSALKALFDQVMIFGIEPFKDRKVQTGNEENESEKTKETEEETATTHNLLQLLSGFLDSEV